MALKSEYPDEAIPDNMSWPEFVYQNFDKFGDRTAIVSTGIYSLKTKECSSFSELCTTENIG